MELLQDGVIAALAAIGVTALIWLAASLLLWRERPVDAVYLVRVSGDGTGLDVTLRRLAQSRRLPVLLVDCGARFLCPVAGSISMMPGTGSDPAYRRIDVDTATGAVRGLF